ncbi:MAG: histidine phosphatase family protein [Ancrocorticia sp.]|uniref:histidine phosphatase family protein n=1 Tax=Ancrocorticia sp. TaxID=2593684 RepID=UPI003F8F6074
MSARRVILWRHGQTDLNVQQRIQGSQDFPLNDVGRAQAARIAPEIAAMAPDRIISSPLSRAADTAQQVVELVGVPMEWDGRLRERNYGQWEGMTREQIQERDPEQFLVWTDGGYPEGLDIERNVDLGERFASAVAEAASDMEGGTLLAVAHGAAIRAGVSTLLGLGGEEWSGLRGMDNCHFAVLQLQTNRTPQWCLVAYNQAVAPANEPIEAIRR